MKKILITGATGFIGGWLVKHFLEKGCKIIAHGSCLDSITKLKNTLKASEVNLKNFATWVQDFLSDNWTFPDFANIDFIIHCAALTKIREGTYENFEKYFKVNLLATEKLAKEAFANNITHFIYLSTGQVFGIPKSFPITEFTPKAPINLYGYTKLMAELVISTLGIFGLNYTIARPFSVYGKGHDNIISIITNKILNSEPLTIYGDGTQTRAFMHVNDICRAIELILNNKNCFKEEYNLSGPKEYSVNELVELISQKFKKQPKIEHKAPIVNELKRNFADTSKLQEIGFVYKESLKDFVQSDLI